MTPETIFTKVLEFFKLGTKVYIALFLLTVFLNFGPTEWLLKLSIKEVVDRYRGWISGTLLLSGAFLITELSFLLGGLIKLFFNKWRQKRVLRDRLYHLSIEEKEVLRGYIGAQTRTQTFSMTDGVINGLAHAKIIYRSAISLNDEFPYNIQEWAWHYLNKKPHLLNDTDGNDA